MKGYLIATIPLLLTLALAGCKLNGDIASPGDFMPPVWDTTVGVTSVVPGENQVTVIWGTATDSMTPPVEYLVYIDTDENPWDQSPVVQPTNDPHVFNDLVNGTEYWCGVRCRDSADPPNVDDNVIVMSATPEEGLVVPDTTPPVWDSTVGVVSVVLYDLEVTVFWGTATDDESPPVEYLVYKDTDNNPFDQEPVVKDNNDPYTFPNLESGTEYWFGVRCRDSAVPANIDTNNIVFSSIPDTTPPVWDDTVGVVSVVPWDKEVTVYFGAATDSQSPPVQYLVYADTDDNPFDQEPVVKDNNESCTVGALQNDLEYWFGVRCRDSANPQNVDANDAVLSATPRVHGWARTWGGPGRATSTHTAVDSDNNVYVAGTFQDSVDFDPGPGVDIHSAICEEDVFLSKFDSSGTFQWALTWGGGNLYSGRSPIVITGSTGNIYVGSFYEGTVDLDPGPGVDIKPFYQAGTAYVSKFDSNGIYQWADAWYSTSLASMDVTGLSLDATESIYSCGVLPDPQYSDGMFARKTNPDGSSNWMIIWNCIDYSQGNYIKSESLAIDNLGNVRVTGRFNSKVAFNPMTGGDQRTPGGDHDAFFITLDMNGNYLGVQTWGGTGVSGVSQTTIVFNDLSEMFIGGCFSGQVDFNPGTGTDIQTTSNGGAFITKFDSLGAYEWTRTWGNPGYASVSDVKITSNQRIVVKGVADDGIIDFDPGPGISEHDMSEYGYYISWFDSEGIYLHAQTSLPRIEQFDLDQFDNIYTAGAFGATTDFDPGPGLDVRSPNGHRDATLVKYFPDGSW
jgi:hypothetical protein